MVYSELANWDGSLDPGPSTISPQHNLITAVKRARGEEGNGKKASTEHTGPRNGDTAFVQNVKDSVSRAMAGWTHKRVDSRGKQSGKDVSQDQVCVTYHVFSASCWIAVASAVALYFRGASWGVDARINAMIRLLN